MANKYPGLFGEWNGRSIDQHASHLTIDGNLALEVAKKLVYRLGEAQQSAAEKLKYEIGENHAQLNRDRFFNECKALFPEREGVLVRGDGRSKNFEKLWLRSSFSGVRMADGQTLPIPAPFVEIVGIRYSQPKISPDNPAAAGENPVTETRKPKGNVEPEEHSEPQQDAWGDYVEKMVLEGAFFREDPWSSGPPDEAAFKNNLKKADADSLKLVKEGKWEDILSLWRPLVGDPLFDTFHPSWEDRPFFVRKIHEGIGALFRAHANLTALDLGHAKPALEFLDAYLNGNLYSMQGADRNHLEIEDARQANENYRATLKTAKGWMDQWGYSIFLWRVPVDLPQAKHWDFITDQIARLTARILHKTEDIDFVLARNAHK